MAIFLPAQIERVAQIRLAANLSLPKTVQTPLQALLKSAITRRMPFPLDTAGVVLFAAFWTRLSGSDAGGYRQDDGPAQQGERKR